MNRSHRVTHSLTGLDMSHPVTHSVTAKDSLTEVELKMKTVTGEPRVTYEYIFSTLGQRHEEALK
jgi:hypothetical protein